MAFEVDFAEFLAGSTGVQALVGSTGTLYHFEADGTGPTRGDARINPSVMREDDNYPAIVYQRISTNRRYSHSGAAGYTTVRMQVDHYAKTPGTAFDLAEAARVELTAFDGHMGFRRVGASFNADEDARFDEDAQVYRVRQDWMVTYEEGTT